MKKDDQTVSGRVVRVSPGQIEIGGMNGQLTRVDIDPDTTVTIDGAPASGKDLKQGYGVIARYRTLGVANVASVVDAERHRTCSP